MPRYLVERDLADAGNLAPDELTAMCRRSCGVLIELGPAIQWVQSYVTDNRIVSTFIAPNAEIIREHARRAGFSADRIDAVRTVIDPTTAED
jgi:hypothetical protein